MRGGARVKGHLTDDLLPSMFTVMDVYEVVSRVKTWVSGNSHGLVVSSVEEDERRINLEAPAGSFFITVPDGQEEWVCIAHC